MLSQTSSGSGGSDSSFAEALKDKSASAEAPKDEVSAAEPDVSMPGTFQGYRILSSVPEPGAQADLFVAEDQNSRCYAIKIYRRSTFRSPGAVQRLSELQSDRLLVPLSQGEWQGRHTEVMPYLPDGSLAGLIKRDGPLSNEQALRLVSQVTEGLEQLHRAGIQHRDLKPTNILVRCREPLDLVLADFGSATMADGTVLTQPHGTLFYSAPETLTGMYSRASDYWSLGVVLIEALTGDSIAATLSHDALLPYRIVQGRVPIPQSLPKGWHPLLKGLLERDHYRRWQGAEVRSWLERANRRTLMASPRKARPLLIVALGFALALAIGAGLSLDHMVTAGNQSNGAENNPTNPKSLTVAPVEQDAHPKREAPVFGIQPDLRSPSGNIAAFLVTTIEALMWIAAGVFLLTGISHLLGGAHHGLIAMVLGLLLAIGAYFLPRLWG